MTDLSCPVFMSRYPVVTMAHGGGGRLMNDLLDSLVKPVLQRGGDLGDHDGAVIATEASRIAYTTDSYVVTPLFFPGGDIGKLCIYGTVNDLAMCGAVPKWISLGLILEEGLPMETLEKVLVSMASAADSAGVRIMTGDTKVVERGKADGLYINTSGIGVLAPGAGKIGPGEIEPGDALIVSGDLGRHGIAVMSAREDILFSAETRSDLAPLNIPVEAVISAGIPVKCLRDLTRGGLAGALNEIAAGSSCSIELTERSVPVTDEVHAACEMLGYDPLYVANEGRMAVFVPGGFVTETLEVLRSFGVTAGAVQAGRVTEKGTVPVSLITSMGTSRVLPMLSGEQLPRIC